MYSFFNLTVSVNNKTKFHAIQFGAVKSSLLIEISVARSDIHLFNFIKYEYIH